MVHVSLWPHKKELYGIGIWLPIKKVHSTSVSIYRWIIALLLNKKRIYDVFAIFNLLRFVDERMTSAENNSQSKQILKYNSLSRVLKDVWSYFLLIVWTEQRYTHHLFEHISQQRFGHFSLRGSFRRLVWSDLELCVQDIKY